MMKRFMVGGLVLAALGLSACNGIEALGWTRDQTACVASEAVKVALSADFDRSNLAPYVGQIATTCGIDLTAMANSAVETSILASAHTEAVVN
jgi:hypothetical protein